MTKLSLAVWLFALPLHAAVYCPNFLSAKQHRALRAVERDGGEVEVFSREIGGKMKTLALVSERQLHRALNAGSALKMIESFDRTGFDYSNPLWNKDWLVNRISDLVLKATVATSRAVQRLRARIKSLAPEFTAHPGDSPDDVTRADALDLARVRAARPRYEDDAARVNDPFASDIEGLPMSLRLDLPVRLALHRPDKLNKDTWTTPNPKLVNLEASYSASVIERLRHNWLTLDFVLAQAVIYVSDKLSEPDLRLVAMGFTGLALWQGSAAALRAFNAHRWYSYLFPFMYVGDRARNRAVVKAVRETLAPDDVDNMLVIVEKRRAADLRERLLAEGFKSATDDKPSFERAL